MAKTGQMTVVPAFAAQQASIEPYYEMFATQLTRRRTASRSPAARWTAILSEELTKAFDGSTTVQDALTAAAGRVNELLAGK